jgi:hypothetical protein
MAVTKFQAKSTEIPNPDFREELSQTEVLLTLRQALVVSFPGRIKIEAL